MRDANPVLIEIIRGGSVESRHRGSAVVADARGRIVASWGDIGGAVFPRSAIKPLQTLAWLESLAADRLTVGDAELALACGSHHGEPFHVAGVSAWLERIGCGERDLVCGPHPPMSESASRELIRGGEPPSRLHNNCSGKHAGLLTACRAFGLGPAGYEAVGHPLQSAIRQLISEVADTPVSADDAAIDGCGVPTYPLPLTALAIAFARLAAPEQLPPRRAAAVRRIVDAMTAQPAFVSGSDAFDSRLLAAGGGQLICKGGAEGVHAAALRPRGLGIAVKIDDGAKRAAEAAIAALIARFAQPSAPLAAVLAAAHRYPLRNTRGEPVGEVRPAADWPD
jgi:L-asparaginase II